MGLAPEGAGLTPCSPSWSPQPAVSGTSLVGNLSATENRPGCSLSLFGPKLAVVELWSQLFLLSGEFIKVSFCPVLQGIILSVWRGKNTHQLFLMENMFFFYLYKTVFFSGLSGSLKPQSVSIYPRLLGDPFICRAISPVYTGLGCLWDDFSNEDISLS